MNTDMKKIVMLAAWAVLLSCCGGRKSATDAAGDPRVLTRGPVAADTPVPLTQEFHAHIATHR